MPGSIPLWGDHSSADEDVASRMADVFDVDGRHMWPEKSRCRGQLVTDDLGRDKSPDLINVGRMKEATEERWSSLDQQVCELSCSQFQ